MDEIRKIPPFTRTVVGAVIGTTLPVILQILSLYPLVFIPAKVVNQLELWRLVAPFLFGGSGLPLVFNLIMLFRSLKDLEESHFQGRLADMTWAFVLMCGTIIGLNTPLRTPILFNPFMMAVIHLWGQTNPTNNVSLYGLITVPAPYFSFALLGVDLLNGGPRAMLVSFTGMVAAHAYHWLSVVYPRQHPSARPFSVLSPPQVLINLLGNGPSVPSSFSAPSAASGAPSTYRTSFGTAFRPASAGGQRLGGGGGESPAGSATGTSSATAAAGRARAEPQQAQHRWGRGNRLGGEGW
ncbi:hypothetical protein JCM21900_003139 [Sporobolomyces salmonicolor]